MGVVKPNRLRAVAALILFVFVGSLGLALRNSDAPLGDDLLQASYDSLQRMAGANPLENSPVAIIYLDLPSYLSARQDPSQPWPRQLHAQLLQRLTAAGAKTVVFDVVFSDAGPSAAADEAFAEAIRTNGRVFLAGEFNTKATHSTASDRVWTRAYKTVAPCEPFVRAAAGWGVAHQIIADDLCVRRYLAGFPQDDQPTLTWAVATWMHLPVTQGISAMQDANQRWLRYYGPPLSVPHVSYSEALDPAGVDNDFFTNKIVFIGARPVAEVFRGRQDEFRSPYHSWATKELFMPGVEVHATEMLNLIRGDWLRRLDPTFEKLILLACAGLFGAGLVWLRPVPAAVAAAMGAGLAPLLAHMAFARGVWFPWLLVSAAEVPTALGGSILIYSLEWYRTRRQLEGAKREADAKIREQAALLDKANDAILVQDLDGRILYANPGAERLYGWKLAELRADGISTELFAPDPAAAAAAREAVLKNGEWNGELRQQTHAGNVIVVASSWTLIRDEISRPKALLQICSDVTEKKQLEAQFLRTQRLNTVGTLAGGMAHDLNNALAPILMGVQLLRRKIGDEESTRLLGLMETNTLRGADMVRQVLLFARGRGGELERLELGPLVRELEDLVRDTFPKNITVESFLPDDLWAVRGNPTQLHQVLLNLCVNARDAMPRGGRLSFVADNLELSATEAAAIPDAKPGEYVSLLVSDTGTGMPPEVRARIFEPFFSTKGEDRGTGIGLSTVRRIVKNHGGCLRVESAPGEGTAFEVFLPRALAPAPVETGAPAAQPPRGHGELIVVADDERAVRELVSDGLVSQGYRVLIAANGAEAVELFRRHGAALRLLITDGAMPVMDGLRAIAEVRKRQPGLPCILTSGEAEADLPATATGVVRLPKPFSLDELLTAVGSSLNRK